MQVADQQDVISRVQHNAWHKYITLIRTGQLKLCRNWWVTVDPRNLCTKCTCANLCVVRKCSWLTVRCYSTVIAGVFHYHLRQHHNFVFFHEFRVYTALELGTYTCVKHKERPNSFNHNMHTLPGKKTLSEIYSNLPAKGLVFPSSLGQTLLSQRQSKRLSTHCPAQHTLSKRC